MDSSIFDLFKKKSEDDNAQILDESNIPLTLEEEVLLELQILCKKMRNWEYIFHVIEEGGIKDQREKHIKFNEFCYKHVEVVINNSIEDVYNAIMLDRLSFVEIIFPMTLKYLSQLNEQLENYERCGEIKDFEENLKIMWLFKKSSIPSQ